MSLPFSLPTHPTTPQSLACHVGMELRMDLDLSLSEGTLCVLNFDIT
jgi:hypothetical protein